MFNSVSKDTKRGINCLSKEVKSPKGGMEIAPTQGKKGVKINLSSKDIKRGIRKPRLSIKI